MPEPSKPNIPAGVAKQTKAPGVYEAFVSMLDNFQEPKGPESKVQKRQVPLADIMYEEAMQALIKNSGGTRQQWEQIFDKVSYAEGGPDRIPTKKQALNEGKEGPGRGLYQYEVDRSADGVKGSNAGFTALNRARNFYTDRGKTPPAFIKQAQKDGIVEFDKLSPKMQTALFILDKLKGDGPTKQMLEGDEGLAKFLADWHYMNESPAKRADYQARFLEKMKTYTPPAK